MATTKAYEDIKQEASSAASDVAGRTKEAASNVADKAREMASATKEKADQAVSSTGSGIASMGSKMRQSGPQEGMLGRANTAVADTIEQTGQYLEEHGLSGMADDVTSVIRRNPIPAVLVSVGIGFLLARMTTTSSRR